MTEQPTLDPGSDEPAVRYRVGTDERLSVAVLAAFEVLGVPVEATPTPLQDWLDPEALDALARGPSPFRLSTIVWGRLVVVTPDEVRIYERRD